MHFIFRAMPLPPLSNTHCTAQRIPCLSFRCFDAFCFVKLFSFLCAFVLSITAFSLLFCFFQVVFLCRPNHFHFFSYLNSFLIWLCAPHSAYCARLFFFISLILCSYFAKWESAWARWPLIVSSQSSSDGSILQHTRTLSLWYKLCHSSEENRCANTESDEWLTLRDEAKRRRRQETDWKEKRTSQSTQITTYHRVPYSVYNFFSSLASNRIWIKIFCSHSL